MHGIRAGTGAVQTSCVGERCACHNCITADIMYKFRTSTTGLNKICSETDKSRIS